MVDSYRGLRLEVLGPIRAWKGNNELDLGSVHRRTVVAVLGISAGHTVSRQVLSDALWGDEPPSSASGSIYSYISALRKVLEPERRPRSGDGLLASVGAGYSLRIGEDCVDVNRFHSLRGSAAKHRRAGRDEDALQDLDQALGLWRGEALAGLPGRFADMQRAKLGELRLATVESRAEILLGLGDVDDLIYELTALRREHGLREPVAGLLMQALAKNNRVAEAIAVFEDLQTQLLDASGIEPGRQLHELHRQLLAGRTAARTERPPATAAETAERPGRPETFVGREDELKSLRTSVSALQAGRGCVVWLEGEPGIGKTALLAEAFYGPPGSEAVLRWVTAQELDSATPAQFVRDCLAVMGEAPASSLLRDDVAQDLDRLIEALAGLAANGPLIFVADDFQWVDDASAGAWWRLARLCDRLPLLLIAVSRPRPRSVTAERVRARVVSSGQVISLTPLSETEILHLAERQADTRMSGGLRAALDGGGGNPRYLLEIIGSYLAAPRRIAIRGDAPDVPSQLAARIGNHLSFLTAQTRSMLQWASLLGREFGLTHLAATGEQNSAELTSSVEEALASGILANDRELLRFPHEVVRQALYHQVPGSVRSWLHRNFAQALVSAGASPGYVAEQLAATSIAMDSWARGWLAAHIGDIAAEKPGLAVKLLRRAIGSAPREQHQSEKHSAVLVRLLFWMGRDADVEARSILARTANPELVGEMRWILAYLQFRRGQLDGADLESRRTLADPRVGSPWRERHERLLDALAGEQSRGNEPSRDVNDLTLLDDASRAAVAAGTASWQLAVRQALPAGILVAQAVERYWTVDGDNAQRELDALTDVEPRLASYVQRRLGVLIHSVAALLAAERDDQKTAELRLCAATECAGEAGGGVPGYEFLLVAKSELAELRGRPAEAMEALLRLAESGVPLSARRLWLPRLARFALRLGDARRLEQVQRAAEAEPAEPHGERYLRRYCEIFVSGDADAMLELAQLMADNDVVTQLALRAFEDAAWLFARARRTAEALDASRAAMQRYHQAGSVWGIRRVDEVTRFLSQSPRHFVNAL
ncbi:DNA-binding transcriptional activator of the SARP family [Amycolatopsis pretoriensis]|uniref:DNA-binding transcriptional activator of the SARP family n=1 Tax=Amycolatopsis pretoriensis TaxID=218821 RepID=A0A1H5QRA1_9PSEU|nr:BTAD domain-containing putative transcriptional regulator [Amycolatopsis pretoriensis]SEF27747.1 DNA-binding transcriptional activator of the SARP family [Amycolatopsis pretoriensis]